MFLLDSIFFGGKIKIGSSVQILDQIEAKSLAKSIVLGLGKRFCVNIAKKPYLFISHKNFYQYLLNQDQLKEFFSKSGFINRPHRLTAKNLEATTLFVIEKSSTRLKTCDLKTSLQEYSVFKNEDRKKLIKYELDKN
ncbi:hypothetical protein BpHYR1_001067 [Brachionus plicatilis]|uniref:Uncharacterized protein n=1 Tax=Brachionus plicatilis TaxID=10195 RepID=A0A3M7RRQ1_BRAPC|nr:hypothetical protein BpHYR1_001067 [Brachionus plicatilis]